MTEQPPEQAIPTESESGPLRANLNTTGSNPVVKLISHMSLTQMTLAVLVVVFLWQWFDAHQKINQVQEVLATRLAEMNGSNKANQTLLTQNQEVVRELGGKLSLLESKYAESQGQRTSLDALYQEMSSSYDQTALTEVEQMLMIAKQQLQLSANAKAALIAMQHADSRLKRLDRPALNGLRKLIAQDIAKLRTVPDIDSSGINGHINDLIALVDSLPLLETMRSQAALPQAIAESDTWTKFLIEVWQETKQLVRIENTQKMELPLLSPTQTFFLRENLKIRLLSARLALLSHDESSFKRDIKTAQEWTQTYFDARTKQSTQMLETLKKLAISNINIELPDITDSLEAVRNYRISHEKATAR